MLREKLKKLKLFGRKSGASNLEKGRGIFALLGLLCILSVLHAIFNIRSFQESEYDFNMEVVHDLAELSPVVTLPPSPPPVPLPSLPSVSPQLEIVDDQVEVEQPDFQEKIEYLEIDMESHDLGDGVVEEEKVEEQIEDVPVTFVKDMPHFTECVDKETNLARDQCTRALLTQKIKENFIVPEVARDNELSGTVFLKFIISPKGEATKIQVLQGVSEALDIAAIEAVRRLPLMIPGKKMGKPVSVIYQVPVRISFK